MSSSGINGTIKFGPRQQGASQNRTGLGDCPAKSEDGFRCTLDAGHGPDHEASAGRRHGVVARWSDKRACQHENNEHITGDRWQCLDCGKVCTAESDEVGS